MTGYDAAFITMLVKSNGIYNFFVEVQDMPLEEIYVACRLFEAHIARGRKYADITRKDNDFYV